MSVTCNSPSHEHASLGDCDAWLCECGNQAHLDGFLIRDDMLRESILLGETRSILDALASGGLRRAALALEAVIQSALSGDPEAVSCFRLARDERLCASCGRVYDFEGRELRREPLAKPRA
jgi:hypothetical protein